jgi:excisionase family DNA binding protein
MDKTNKQPENKINIPHLLKGKDIAEILNISRSFAYYIMQSGEIPTVRLGHSVRVRPQDLTDYIEKRLNNK